MFKESFKEVFDKFKFQFFCRIFDLVRERDGSLTAMEAFSLEIIDMLQAPTVSQFADFLDISQSNATYKVNSLIRKGYLVRKVSDLDRREAHLILSEKYRSYMSLLTSYEDKVMDRIAARFPQEDLDTLQPAIDMAVDIIKSFVLAGIDVTMNQYNKLGKRPTPSPSLNGGE